jgi:hypothetical protein
MHSTQRNGLYLMGLAVAMIAGMAFAADARFDEADANINKAIALLKAAEIPAGKPRAVAKRDRAVDALDRAKKRIACAKELTDGAKKCSKRDDEDDGSAPGEVSKDKPEVPKKGDSKTKAKP